MHSTRVAVKEAGREMARILVVDDEKSICELLEITFRKEGHRVEVAHSVEAAKRKLESALLTSYFRRAHARRYRARTSAVYPRDRSRCLFRVDYRSAHARNGDRGRANEGANRYVIQGRRAGGSVARAVREVSENLKWKRSGLFAARSASLDGARQYCRARARG